MSFKLLAEAMKIDAVPRGDGKDRTRTTPTPRPPRSAAALPSNVIQLPLTSRPSRRQATPAVEAASAAAPVLRLVHSAARDEARELRMLISNLERFELPGDVGRMIYLAIETAAAERAQAMKGQRRPVSRGHALQHAALRFLNVLRPKG